MLVNKTFGVISSFIVCAAALPFLASRGETPKTKTITEKDFEFIKALADDPKNNDFRTQETKWAKVVYPTIRERVINLYRAEIEDLKALREGKITEKERKVKVCLTDFVPSGAEGDDMGVGPKLHVVKYFDEKLPNGKFYRTYLNAHLPVNEKTGVVHPTDVMRIKVQVFGNGIEDLYKPDAEFLFVADKLQIAWGKNFPYFSRQHFYGDYDKDKRESSILQTEEILSVPNSCYFCHEVSRSNAHTKHIFKDQNVKKINYGAITQDYEFELPLFQQPGYKRYVAYLNEKVRKGELTKEDVARISKDLGNSISYSSLAPLMLRGFQENNEIPWLEGDEKATEKDKGLYRFTYQDGKEMWTRRLYSYYRPHLLDMNTLQIIPRK